MKGKEDSPDASRAEELWAKWLDEGKLPKQEEEELVRAVIADPRLRETILQDQRIEGALTALARTAADGPAFARQFVQRVAAERDGASFVSSVERSVRSEVVAGALVRGRAFRLRLLPWLLIPAVVGAVALFFLLWRDGGRDAEVQTAGLEPPRSSPPEEKRSLPFLRTPPPQAALQGQPRIADVDGQVYLLVEAQRLTAVRGSQVPSGAGLVTVGNSSHAVVTLGEQTRLTLEGDTVLAQLAEANGAGVAKAAFLARGRLTVQAPAQSNERFLVVITPHAEMSSRGGRFLLFVDSTSTRLDVHEGTATLARMDGGSTTVGAAQYALIGERGDALAMPMSRGGIALLVTGLLTLSNADSLIKKRLEALGFEVRTQQAGPPRAEDLRRARLIVISSTSQTRDMGVHFRDLVTPLIVCEPYFFDDLGMTASVPVLEYGYAISRGAALIKDPAHPLAAGLTGTAVLLEADKPIVRRVRRMSYGVPGPHAQVVAVWPSVPSRAMVFAYEKGTAMPGMAAAPGRRVGLFLHDRTAEALSETGWTIFDAAVRWSLRD